MDEIVDEAEVGRDDEYDDTYEDIEEDIDVKDASSLHESIGKHTSFVCICRSIHCRVTCNQHYYYFLIGDEIESEISSTDDEKKLESAPVLRRTQEQRQKPSSHFQRSRLRNRIHFACN